MIIHVMLAALCITVFFGAFALRYYAHGIRTDDAKLVQKGRPFGMISAAGCLVALLSFVAWFF